MSTDSKHQLLENALQLPENDRAELAGKLIDSLETEFDEGVEAAWSEEIARRIEDLDSGAVQAVSREDARRQILGVDEDESET